MKPEAQQIAIAKACGWTFHKNKETPSLSFNGAKHSGDTWKCPKRGFGYGEYEPPDYLNDLNVMHEAEKKLTHDQQMQYVRFISNPWDTDPNGNYWKMWLCAKADAAQRAEAFLRTIGKWVE